MKKIAISLGIVIIVVFSSILIVPSFINWSAHKDTLVKKLEDSYGYDIDLSGDLTFSVLPYPHLALEKFSVSNSTSEVDGYKILSVEKADIQLELFPLLRKQIVVSKIRLIKPELDLIYNKSGKPLWLSSKINNLLSSSKSSKDSNNTLINSIRMDEVEIDSGSFELRNYSTNKEVTINNIEQIIKGESLFGPYDLEGSFSYNGKTINTKITTGRADTTQSIAVQTDINVPSLSTSIHYSGVIDYSEDYGALGEAIVKTDNLGELIKSFHPIKHNINLAHAFSANGLLEYNSKGISYKNLNLSLPSFDASGFISLKKPEKSNNLFSFNFDLASDSTLNLNRYITSQDKKELQSFLPQSVTLPFGFDVSGTFKIGALQYKQAIFNYINTQIDTDNYQVKIKTSFDIAKHSSFRSEAIVKFNSQSSFDNSITLSDPIIQSKSILKSNNFKSVLDTVQPNNNLPALKDALSHPGNAEFEVTVLPNDIKINRANINSDKGEVSLNAGYSLRKSTRDYLKIGLNIKDIEIPAYKKKKVEGDKVKPINLDTFINSLNVIPIDLDLEISLADSELFPFKIKNSAINLAINEKSIHLKSLQIEEQDSTILSASGVIGDVNTLSDLSADVNFKTENFEAVLNKMSLNENREVNVGKINFVTEFQGNKNQINFISNIKALNGELELKGLLLEPLNRKTVNDLVIKLNHPDLKALSQNLGLKIFNHIESNREISIKSIVDYNHEHVKFNDINAKVGRVEFKGNVGADITKNKKPNINADLNFINLPLDEVLGHRFSKKVNQKKNQKGKSDKPRGKWSEDPIKLSWLDTINFKIKSTCKNFKYGNWVVSNADIFMELTEGTLQIHKINGLFHDGNILFKGKISKADNADNIRINTDISANDITLESFVNSFSGSKVLKTKGKVSLVTKVKGEGHSPHTLIGSLEGEGSSKGSNIIIEGIDLAKLSRVLSTPSSSMTENFGTVLTGTMGGGATRFDTMSSEFSINNGLVSFRTLDFFGPEASIKSKGELSLPLWKIDLKSSIKLVEPPDSPALDVLIKGPIDQPMQTFGKSAMDAYFNSQLNNLIEQTIIKKLNNKGILPKSPDNDNQTQPSELESHNFNETTQKSTDSQSKEPDAEDIFRGLLQGIIEN